MSKHGRVSLVVLAAGMGSRYGGLKQMDSFGPNGETIIDYSLLTHIVQDSVVARASSSGNTLQINSKRPLIQNSKGSWTWIMSTRS